MGINVGLALALGFSSVGRSAVNIPLRDAAQLANDQVNKMRPQQDKALKYLSAIDRGEGFIRASAGKANPLMWTNDNLRSWIDDILFSESETLGITELSDYKKAANKIQNNIVKWQTEIGEMQKAKLGAPLESTLSFITRQTTSSREYYEREIANRKANCEVGKADLVEIEGKMADYFASNNIPISPDQVRSLLYTVVGDEDVRIFSVFKNIKLLSELYRQRAVEDNSTDMIRWYYGIHTLMVRSLLTLHERYIKKIDNNYLPELDRIISQNQALVDAEKVELAKPNTAQSLKEQNQRNIATLGVTRKTADLYKKYLGVAKQRIIVALGKIDKQGNTGIYAQYDAAERTYLVWDNAKVLIDATADADRIQELLDIKVPELQQFESKEMEEKFRELTMRLK